MGASDFHNTGVAKTAQEAFRVLADEDTYENGHSYSGGIGMKHGFVTFELPKGLSVDEFVTACMDVFRRGSEACGEWKCEDCAARRCRKGLDPYLSRKAVHVAWRKTAYGARATKVYKKVAADPALLAMVKRAAEVANDKWAEAVCVEVKGAAAKPYIDRYLQYRGTKIVNGKRVPLPRPRGLRVWTFFGLSPS